MLDQTKCVHFVSNHYWIILEQKKWLLNKHWEVKQTTECLIVQFRLLE